MATEIDELLEQIRDLSRRIDTVGTDSPEADRLIDERAALRRRAKDLSDERRHPDSVRSEIELIEERLAEIEALSIGEASSEKWFKQTIQDPGAYRYTINRLLDEEHDAEVSYLTERRGIYNSKLNGFLV